MFLLVVKQRSCTDPTHKHRFVVTNRQTFIQLKYWTVFGGWAQRSNRFCTHLSRRGQQVDGGQEHPATTGLLALVHLQELDYGSTGCLCRPTQQRVVITAGTTQISLLPAVVEQWSSCLISMSAGKQIVLKQQAETWAGVFRFWFQLFSSRSFLV